MDNLGMGAELEVLTNYPLVPLPPTPDGVLSFTYRQVVKLLKDCKKNCSHGVITPSYLLDLQKNIRALLQQAEERSQMEDLSLIKEPAEKVLSVIERPSRSLEDLAGMLLYHTSLYSSLLTNHQERAAVDGQNLIRSLELKRTPCKSDYQTVTLISSGAFGSVHLVRHKDSDQIFAMKKLDRQGLNKDSVRRAFLERDILAFTECPFVAPMLSSFTTRDHLCMVMEYVGGGDCGTLLKKRGPLSVSLARMYIAEVVLAVEYLHSHGVVHRDLKPDNLLISSTGHIKVTDFGLSKLGLMRTTNIDKVPIEDITTEFHDRQIVGTPRYIAPEVLMQIGYGRPVDWWAVGIILHVFLVGSEPFVGKTKQDLFIKITEDDVTWDSNNTVLPPDAQDIISKLLRKNPAYRLGTGGANEIKSHPFFCDLDFDNILSQKPEYVPQLMSDIDTSYFYTRSEKYHHMVSENEEDTREDTSEHLVLQNFTSSSHQLSKLYTTNTRMTNNEECSPEHSPEDSEMQKESSSGIESGESQPSRNNTVESPLFRPDAGALLPSTPEDSEKHLPSREDDKEHLPSREDAEQPLPSRENAEKPLPSTEDTEQPLPSTEDAEQPLPSTEDAEQPLPSTEDAEQPLPSTEDAEKPLPSTEDAEQPLPTTEDTEQPLPSREDAEQPLPSREDAEKPLPYGEDAGQPLPSREDTEQPLPSREDAEKPLPYGEDAEQPLPSREDAEQPLPSREDAEKPLPYGEDDEEHLPSTPDAKEPSLSREDGGKFPRANSDNQWLNNISLSFSSTLSDYPLQKAIRRAALQRRQQECESMERESRRGSIFRRLLSSCRRGLSRVARSIRKSCIFACCHHQTSETSDM